VGWCLE